MSLLKTFYHSNMISVCKEWFVEAPWGKIACVSWGNPEQPPLFLIHGYMDSAATFIPTVKHLADSYYCVAIDIPGHGKSDAFPVGPLVNQGHQVDAVRRVIEHLKWKKFAIMTHSIGFVIGALYNFLYPYRVLNMVNLDPVPPLSTYCFHQYSPSQAYSYSFEDYYENIARWDHQRTKRYTHEQAINLLVKSRKLTREQSATVLSRTLIPVEDGKYRLSWEPTMRKVVSLPITEDYLCTIITQNAPPMLNIVASKDNTIEPFKKRGLRIVSKIQDSCPNFLVLNVEGTHDVHITNPERFVDEVKMFLNKTFNVQAKL